MRSLALAAAVLAVSGCARESGDVELPAPCTSSDAALFAGALEAAPAPVRADGVAISDCLPKGASAGDVQAVGALMLATARRLVERERPLALGYLVGALRRGAEGSPGLHLEIVRRVEQEAEPLRAAPGFARGERAGRTSG